MKNQMGTRKTKYIFVVGGVMSGVGKGIASSSIGRILQDRGLVVSVVKIDQYVNVDAGTMNPTEHGEVFVLDDGTECDQDMGNYERFLGRDFDTRNYMTTGSIYRSVIQKERNLEYGGKCVEVVPHIPLEVIAKINAAAKKDSADVIIVEIGGTVGEYQIALFLEAVRILKLRRPENLLLVLVSHLPYQGDGGELKTKPTQYAARTLNGAGLQPDIIIGRAKFPLDEKRKEKISFNCSVPKESVISAPDVESVYDVPVNFERDNLSAVIMKRLGLKPRRTNSRAWRAFVKKSHAAVQPVRIGIVGKYFGTGSFILSDSYISVIESVKHAAYAIGRKPQIEWLNAEDFDGSVPAARKNLINLKQFDGIIVPGGFGNRGIEGKIAVIQHCRERKIPYFGLCYGMQLMVVEYARHLAGMKGAHTTEVNPKTPYPVIDILPEQRALMAKKNYGGTMRLGACPAALKPNTVACAAYSKNRKLEAKNLISERHRHRYEVNPEYIEALTKAGLVFSGTSPDGALMEIAELPKARHPFFLGTQFHPELKSRPLEPHPLFKAFISAVIKNNNRMKQEGGRGTRVPRVGK